MAIHAQPEVHGWHAFKGPDGRAEVVIVGHGFTDIKGMVHIEGDGGRIQNTITRWTDTNIVAEIPDNRTIRRVQVVAPGARGTGKIATNTGNKQSRSSSGMEPVWTVTSTDDELESIVFTGTGLDAVQDIFLYDETGDITLASYFRTASGVLHVDYPASFVNPIRKARLSDGNDGGVREILADQFGWTPAANGIITDATVSLVGDTSYILSIFGSSFGTQEGVVRLTKEGGATERVSPISNSWSQSLVQVPVAPETTYVGIELTRADGEKVAYAASAPAVIAVPALPKTDPIITDLRYDTGSIEVVGTNLLSLGETNFHVGIRRLDSGVDYTVSFNTFNMSDPEYCAPMLDAHTETVIRTRDVRVLRERFSSGIFGTPGDFELLWVGIFKPGERFGSTYFQKFELTTPVMVDYTPYADSEVPIITGLEVDGQMLTIKGQRFDLVPRNSNYSYLSFMFSNGGGLGLRVPSVPGEPGFDDMKRFVSIKDTEIVFDWSKFGFTTPQQIAGLAISNQYCGRREHRLANPVVVPEAQVNVTVSHPSLTVSSTEPIMSTASGVRWETQDGRSGTLTVASGAVVITGDTGLNVPAASTLIGEASPLTEVAVLSSTGAVMGDWDGLLSLKRIPVVSGVRALDHDTLEVIGNNLDMADRFSVAMTPGQLTSEVVLSPLNAGVWSPGRVVASNDRLPGLSVDTIDPRDSGNGKILGAKVFDIAPDIVMPAFRGTLAPMNPPMLPNITMFNAVRPSRGGIDWSKVDRIDLVGDVSTVTVVDPGAWRYDDATEEFQIPDVRPHAGTNTLIRDVQVYIAGRLVNKFADGQPSVSLTPRATNMTLAFNWPSLTITGAVGQFKTTADPYLTEILDVALTDGWRRQDIYADSQISADGSFISFPNFGYDFSNQVLYSARTSGSAITGDWQGNIQIFDPSIAS